MRRVVIVGGVAGGATAAARINRLAPANITILERSPDVSFANCGLPYYLGREIPNRDSLSLHTPASLGKMIGSQVRTRTEATKIDRESKTVTCIDLVSQKEEQIPYDVLLLSPGASPIVPPLPGLVHERVKVLRNLQDMDRIDDVLKRDTCKRVAVIGAGFIGLEIVEQLAHKNMKVSLVDVSPTVLPQADPEMSSFLHQPIASKGVELKLGNALKSITHSGEVSTVELASGESIEADLVILCIGVKPETKLARDCGLTIAPRGQIVVNDFMQTNDPNIYAVGDAVETRDLVFPDRRAWVALGNTANMQARIAADHAMLGKSIPYPGSVGSSIVRAFDMTLAVTGWNETRLRQAQIPHRTTTITALDHAGYYPGAEPITMKITFDPETGRLFGAQAVGVKGVDKRVDVIATAIQGRLTIDDISVTQLTYSPPFGAARDAVNVAGLSARNQRDGLLVPAVGGEKLLDIRTPDNAKEGDIPNSQKVQLPDVVARKDEIEGGRKTTTVCDWGKTAYFAHRNLAKAGVETTSIVGGWRVQKMRQAYKYGEFTPADRTTQKSRL